MGFDFAHIFSNMSVYVLAVVAVLGIMAVAFLTVAVERLWVYAVTERRSKHFAAVAGQKLQAHSHRGLASQAAAEPKNPLAELIAGGLATYHRAIAGPALDVGPVELLRREVDRRSDVISAQLRRGLSTLASVGSVAPFVGLLGTVIGIIAAFQTIGAEGTGLDGVMPHIAEALVVTAMGLFVAIPAVLVFNVLSTKADKLMMAIDQARGEFVDHMEAHHSIYAADNAVVSGPSPAPKEEHTSHAA